MERGKAPHKFTVTNQGQENCLWAELRVPRLANTGQSNTPCLLNATHMATGKAWTSSQIPSLSGINWKKKFWQRGPTGHKKISKLCRPEVSISKPNRWPVMGLLWEASCPMEHASFIATLTQGWPCALLLFMFSIECVFIKPLIFTGPTPCNPKM